LKHSLLDIVTCQARVVLGVRCGVPNRLTVQR
jgi:hypothetical protein